MGGNKAASRPGSRPIQKRGYGSGTEPVSHLPKPADPGPAGASQDASLSPPKDNDNKR